MKNIVFTVSLFVLILNSCCSQNVELIKGNWYIDNNFESENFDYTEVYVDNDYFHYYNEVAGLSTPRKYKITNDNTIYLVELKVSYKFKVKGENTFTILNDKGEEIIYKRVLDINNLSKYINRDLDENVYYNAIEERKKKISSEKAAKSNIEEGNESE